MAETEEEEGWKSYQYSPPLLRDCPIEIRAQHVRSIVCADDLNPAANIVGMEWRETGLYKERWARLPIEVRRQLQVMYSASPMIRIESASHFPGIICDYGDSRRVTGILSHKGGSLSSLGSR